MMLPSFCSLDPPSMTWLAREMDGCPIAFHSLSLQTLSDSVVRC